MKTIKKIIFMDDANTFINTNEEQEIKKFFSAILENLSLILKKKLKCEINVAETMDDLDIVCFYQFMENGQWTLYRYNSGENQQDPLLNLGAFVNADGDPYPIECVHEKMDQLAGQNDDLLLVFCDYKWAYAPEEYRNMPFRVFEAVRNCENCFLIYYTSIEPEAAQEFVEKVRNDNPGIQCRLFKNEWSVSKYAKSSKADLDKTIFNLYNAVAELNN